MYNAGRGARPLRTCQRFVCAELTCIGTFSLDGTQDSAVSMDDLAAARQVPTSPQPGGASPAVEADAAMPVVTPPSTVPAEQRADAPSASDDEMSDDGQDGSGDGVRLQHCGDLRLCE